MLKKKEYKNLSEEEFYRKFFHILNSIQDKDDRLTDREIEVATQFLAFKPKHEIVRFGKDARKEIADIISQYNKKEFTVKNLNIALNTLKKKGVIIEDKHGEKHFHNYIIKNVKNTSDFTFQIVLEKQKEDGDDNGENREPRTENIREGQSDA